jgi:putative addiction module component (TIGR02574 family)
VFFARTKDQERSTLSKVNSRNPTARSAAVSPVYQISTSDPGSLCRAVPTAEKLFRSRHDLKSIGELLYVVITVLASKNSDDYNYFVATIIEIEKLALDLSENERAVLAAHLLGSLPPVLHDADEGIAEALRRDAELEANPSGGLSLEQLDQQIERRRT